MPLLAAALRPEITHVVAGPGSFAGVADNSSGELDDYLRMFPGKRDLVERTLSYFDPHHFADAVRARTLLWGDPATLGSLAESITGETEIRRTDPSQYKEGLFEEHWISEQLGFPEPALPYCWR